MNIPALLDTMLVMFLTIVVGYAAAKLKIMNEDINKAISALVVGVTNPLQVLASVLNGQRLLSNTQVLLLSLIALGCYAFLIGASLLVPKLLRVKGPERNLFRFMFIFGNIGFLGYPLVSALFGEDTRFYVTVFVLFFQLVVWSYGVSLIAGEERFHFTSKILLRPCIVSALLSYAIYFSGLRFPAVIGRAAKTVGELTSPLAMLVIGCSLAQFPLKQVFGRWRVYGLAALKMVCVPLLAYFLLRGFVTDQLILGVTVVILAMPVATNTTMISYQQHADVDLASSGVFLSTLISVVSVPLLMSWLFG